MAIFVPLLLFLPGYGITAILFSGRGLDIPARLLLSVALSLATTAFSGLILHLTPQGISLQNPLIILLIGGPGIVGLYSLVNDVLRVDEATTFARIGFNSRQVLLLLLAAVIATAALAVARTSTSPNNLTAYTMLWIQPGSSPDRLKLGVRSEEFRTTRYQLRFEVNEVVREGPTFELMPGQTQEYVLRLDDKTLTGQPVVVLLYRLDRPDEAYRRVVWWNEDH